MVNQQTRVVSVARAAHDEATRVCRAADTEYFMPPRYNLISAASLYTYDEPNGWLWAISYMSDKSREGLSLRCVRDGGSARSDVQSVT